MNSDGFIAASHSHNTGDQGELTLYHDFQQCQYKRRGAIPQAGASRLCRQGNLWRDKAAQHLETQ